LIAPEDREKFKEFNKRVCAGEKGSLEFEIIGLQGVRRHMESHSVPLHNPDGSVLHLSVTRDISDRQQAEDRERQLAAEAIAATAKFRAVFEQTTVFAGIMTKDGIMIDANKLCLEACGYTADQTLGKMFWQTPWWRNFKESQEKIRAATPLAAEGTPFREILHYSWADGTDRIVDFALYPILDQDGKVIFLHPTGVDITELKNAEEKFRKLAETLDAEVRDRTRELEVRSADVVRQSEQLRELSWRLLRTQDEERRRIARELHDSAGQTLTVLGINLAQLAQKVARTSPELLADAEMIQETVQQLHREIRTTSYLLHPPLLDESGLSSALNWYVSGLVERSDLDIQLTISDDFGRLPNDMELVVFRLVQESLTNIHRHSGSRTASIQIARDAERISVHISDQGKGMSPERLAEVQSRGAGVGLRGIRERLRQFRAKMDIESDSSGTRIGVTIPIPPDAPWKKPNEVESLPTMQQS
jgi:PAS domain S-box-containing protein